MRGGEDPTLPTVPLRAAVAVRHVDLVQRKTVQAPPRPTPRSGRVGLEAAPRAALRVRAMVSRQFSCIRASAPTVATSGAAVVCAKAVTPSLRGHGSGCEDDAGDAVLAGGEAHLGSPWRVG